MASGTGYASPTRPRLPHPNRSTVTHPPPCLFVHDSLTVAGTPVNGAPPVLLIDAARLVTLPFAEALQLADVLLRWAGVHLAAERGHPACPLAAAITGAPPPPDGP